MLYEDFQRWEKPWQHRWKNFVLFYVCSISPISWWHVTPPLLRATRPDIRMNDEAFTVLNLRSFAFQSHSCHAQAQCVNIQGSSEFRCLSEYLGDGRATCAGNFEINHAKKHHTTVFYSRRHRQETMSWESLSSIDAPLLMITSKTWSESAVILSGCFGQYHVQTDGVAFLI